VTLNRFWTFLAVALPVLAALIANLSSVDLAYHLRAGDEILTTRAIPAVDTWTFTAAGLPWVDQQWGAQAILAAIYGLGGWTGLVVSRAALVGVIFGCLFVIARRRGLGPRRGAWLTLVAFAVSAVALALRPQLLGMALFAIVLLLIVDRRAHPGRLWVIPLVMLVWANVHGSFFLGPLVLGLAWLEDAVDRDPGANRVLLVAIASALVACITPFGPAVWAYAVGLSVNPQVTERITEWQPTSLRTVPGLLFFGSALAVVALIARRGSMTSWPRLAWLGAFFLIGAYAIRGVAWWPLAAVPAVAGALLTEPEAPAVAREDPPLIRRLNAILATAIVLVGIALLPIWRPIDPGLQAPAGVVGNAPPGITAFLRDTAEPGDRVFDPQPWGSWFEFSLPHLAVALDSRIELFPETVWADYEGVIAGRDGWEDRLESWGVTVIVAAGEGQDAFVERLERAGWVAQYDDADGVVLRRPAAAAVKGARSTAGRPDLRPAVCARTGLLESAA
jgi:MFS family permease